VFLEVDCMPAYIEKGGYPRLGDEVTAECAFERNEAGPVRQ
jgi:hypothetical protein